MELSLKTYTAYSIGCAVVWAVILAVVSSEASKDNALKWGRATETIWFDRGCCQF